VSRLDKGDPLSFFASLEKRKALLKALYIVHHPHPGIARMANPSAECPSLVTMVEMETLS
jgi:hypothetical protein